VLTLSIYSNFSIVSMLFSVVGIWVVLLRLAYFNVYGLAGGSCYIGLSVDHNAMAFSGIVLMKPLIDSAAGYASSEYNPFFMLTLAAVLLLVWSQNLNTKLFLPKATFDLLWNYYFAAMGLIGGLNLLLAVM